MKNNYLISTLFTASLLAACAGGGMDEPKTPVSVPGVSAAAAPVFHADDARAVSLSTGGGKVRLLAGADGKPETAFQSGNGQVYRFNSYSDPMVPSSFSPSYRFPTRHAGQGADGGKWLACCTEAARFSYGPATRLESGLRFGAWARADGAAELFAGGLPADAALMPGGSNEAVRGMKGKATYEVLAVRAREGGFATSSYTPKHSTGSLKEPVVRSLITANFNTAKLGGTIVGNDDFGADIVLRDVDIRGNAFSGSAQSDGHAGKVDGRFFGEAQYGYDKTLRKPAGGDIGGIITFDGANRLNAAFGGSRTAYDPKTEAGDLSPLE